MATAHRIAPIFSVRDLDAAMEFYRRLGFQQYCELHRYVWPPADAVEAES